MSGGYWGVVFWSPPEEPASRRLLLRAGRTGVSGRASIRRELAANCGELRRTAVAAAPWRFIASSKIR
jgi:hypothetical protein